MNLEEMKKKLEEYRQQLAAFKALGDDITEEQMESYRAVKLASAKLRLQIEGIEEEAEAAKMAEAQREADTEKKINDAVAAKVIELEAKYRRPAYVDGPALVAKFGDTWKYDQLDGPELGLMIDMQNQFHAMGKMPAVSVGALKAMSLRVAEMKPEGKSDVGEEEHRKNVAYVKSAFKAETNIEPTKEGVEAAIKAATDPMYTGASPMSDWVGTAYSQAIWEKIRGGLVVANRIPSDVIPDGFSSKVWPVEGADFTFYKTAEVTAADATMKVPAATVTASQLTTSGNKTLSVGKISARGMYSGEAEEDSLIAFAPQARLQLEKRGMEVLEHVIIDGDTETSATKNINSGGSTGTIAGTEVFLVTNGLRKLALVTNTANSRSAGGSFVVTDYKDTLKLMGAAGLNASDPTQVAFIIDYNTMWATMDLPELKTKDVSNYATIEEGVVTRIYRTQILNSFQMHGYSVASGYERKVNSAGYVDKDTNGNNLYGAILAVRFDQWKQAFKRRMTLEVTRFANSDSWEIVAHMRWGLVNRDNEASAITYYVAV